MGVQDVLDNGSFEFTNLPTGNYAVAAIKAGAPPILRSGVEVQRGQSTDVLVTIPLGSAFTALVEFRGRGGPVVGAVVELGPLLVGRDNPLEERVTREALTEANGRAPFTGLKSGTHRVRIRTPWGDELTEQVEIQTQVRKPEQRFLFFPPARLSGRVVDPMGQGVSGSEVRCIQRSEWSIQSGGRVRFGGWGGVSSRQGGEVATTITDAGGNFEFERVPTRTSFTVAATSSQAGSGGAEAVGGFGMSGPVHLESGESRAGLILRLGEGFELRGTVRDLEGLPLAGAQVQGTVTWKRQELEARVTSSDADGVFVLHGVPAGRCRLTAELEGYTLNDLDKKVEGNMQGLEIQAKPAHTLEGVVLDPAGWGIGGAHVRARDARRRSRRATADEFGRFILEDLAPGPWGVNATASGFGAGSGGALAVEVPVPTDIVLRLEPEVERAPCVLTGEIAMKGNGTPVPGLRFHGYRYRTISLDGTRFELTGPPANKLTLTATSPKAESVTFPMVHLAAGDRVDLGRVETRHTIAVTVHVTDGAGRALPDADVILQRIPGEDRGELLVIPKSVRLQPGERKGEFRFDQVGMYKWQLVVRHKAWQAKSLQVKVSNSSKTFNVQLTKDRRRGGGDQ